MRSMRGGQAGLARLLLHPGVAAAASGAAPSTPQPSVGPSRSLHLFLRGGWCAHCAQHGQGVRAKPSCYPQTQADRRRPAQLRQSSGGSDRPSVWLSSLEHTQACAGQGACSSRPQTQAARRRPAQLRQSSGGSDRPSVWLSSLDWHWHGPWPCTPRMLACSKTTTRATGSLWAVLRHRPPGGGPLNSDSHQGGQTARRYGCLHWTPLECMQLAAHTAMHQAQACKLARSPVLELLLSLPGNPALALPAPFGCYWPQTPPTHTHTHKRAHLELSHDDLGHEGGVVHHRERGAQHTVAPLIGGHALDMPCDQGRVRALCVCCVHVYVLCACVCACP